MCGDRYMTQIEFFKNFNMGRELEISGEFLYESMREMYSLKSFYNHYQINKILYNGSVGIERLQKILLCMHLLNTQEDFSSAPKLLYEHNHIALYDKARTLTSISFHKNLVNLLSTFQEYYNDHRYGEFYLDYDSNDLVKLFVSYFSNITKKAYNLNAPNDPQDLASIRRLYINNLGQIAREYFTLIKAKADELCIYTTELPYESNAGKVFYLRDCEKMYDRINLESLAVKELIVYISKIFSKGNYKKISRHIKKIPFDPAMINEYLTDITTFRASSSLTDAVENYYEECETAVKTTERLKLIDLIGNPYAILD